MGKSQKYNPDGREDAFGTRQGSGGSPTFWKLIDDIILQTMDNYGYGMEITNPTKQRTNRRNEDVFVDDAALGVDGRDDRVTERLGEKIQQHEQALYASGGKLALDKCTWILLQWAW